MEFKGTKGKWIADAEKGTVIKSDGNRLCLLYYTNYKNKNEIPYNALLISKAPEMLDMLKFIKTYGANSLSKEIETLIKQATEL
ncbi:MAG: hypothetical protein [Caudoviricetes sp.]|nr:MAG: hypothetical protein [Caudoviricetes sp.]